MLPRLNSRLHVSLDDGGARVRLARGYAFAPQPIVFSHEVTLDPAPIEIAEVIGALDQALQETTARGHHLAGLRCDVVISDTWMLYDVIEADLDEAPRRAADELVRATLADTAGIKPGDISARWQKQGEARNFACAVPVDAMQGLQGVLNRHKLRLGSVNGELVLMFNSSRHGLSPKRSVLAVSRTAGTQLGLIVDGGFAALRYEPSVCEPVSLLDRSRALMRCAGFEPDAVTRYYADEALPADAETPWVRRTPERRWRRLGGSELTPLELDLSPTRARVPQASWLLLAAGALAVTVAAFQFQTASGQHLREARVLHELEASLNEARSGGAVRASPQEVHGARATAAVVRELQVPWARLFAALESVAGRNVALLSVEPSALRQEVRIVAEAKTSGAMLDFLEALREQSLREVVLVSHQVQTQTPGAPIRFQARALWGST